LARFLRLLGFLALMPAATHAFDLQGHRGARGLAPENTLPAFAAALGIGVTTLELDVGVTRDGVVVVHHDLSLNPDIARGPDGAWLEGRGPAIAALGYDELARFDVGRIKPGTDYAKRFAAQKPAEGTRIPRLADLFELVRKSGNKAVRFNIETKVSPVEPQQTLEPEPFARALLAAIRKAGMEDRVTIQSFDWRTLALVQKEAPDIPTVYLSARQRWTDNILADSRGGSPWTAGQQFRDHGSIPKMVHAAGGRIWSPYFGELDAAQLAEARALGLKVVVWTVNEPAHIRAMLDLGVDGIISDRPDLVRAEMAARGMPLPKPTPVSP
jgi:glycerophosphoryl diester phosphodiesterase